VKRSRVESGRFSRAAQGGERRPDNQSWQVENSGPVGLAYRLCPSCGRAVPLNSPERYCINDGVWMLEGCPLCGALIGSPYARYCLHCGLALRSFA